MVMIVELKTSPPKDCVRKPFIYHGTWFDLNLVANGFLRTGDSADLPGRIGWAALGLIDLPISATVDTMMLPLGIYDVGQRTVRCY